MCPSLSLEGPDPEGWSAPASLDSPVGEEEEIPLEVSSEDVDLARLVPETSPVSQGPVSSSSDFSVLLYFTE